LKSERLPVRKAIAINDERGKIHDLFSLVALVRTQAKKLLQGSRFRILPTMIYDVHFHTYIFLVEYMPNQNHPSFEDTMSKLKGTSSQSPM